MPKKFGAKQTKIYDTCFSKCHLGQNRKKNICEIYLNWTRVGFDIPEEDMSKRIYEKYLGICGKAEMWVASQPRANRVIPLIEKRNIPKKNNNGIGPRWK